MSSYIGKANIAGDMYAIGTTLYGYSETPAATAAKEIILPEFNKLIDGVTVYIKFTLGNSVSSSVSLSFKETSSGSAIVAARDVIGNCTCNANEILAFTYEDDPSVGHWRTHTCGGVITQNDLDTALANLGPMRFQGVYQTLPANNATNYSSNGPAINNGDVIAVGSKEYVYVASDTSNHWHEIGDEAAYVKNSEIDTTNLSLLNWAGASVVDGVLTIPAIGTPTTVEVVIPAPSSP